MSKKEKWVVIYAMLLGLIVTFIPVMPSKAASATVTLSLKNDEVKLNDTFYVIVTIEASASIGGFETFLSYDENKIRFVDGGDIVTGGDGVLRISDMNPENLVKSRTYMLQFEAIEQGNVCIEAMDQAYVYTYEDSQEMSVSCNSLSIPIGTDETVSNNSDLYSLKISPGKLSPSFSTKVTKYTTTVDESTNKIVISAIAKDADAKIITTGNNKLEVGPNKVDIIVTAPSGDKRVYTIIVTREGEPIQDSEEEEAETEEVISSYQDAVDHNGMFITQDETSTIFLFASEYTLAELEDESMIPKGFEATKMNLQELDLVVYEKKDVTPGEYVLLYLSRQGEEAAFYRLDLKDYTIQRYEGQEEAQEIKSNELGKSEYEEKLSTMRILVIVSCALTLIVSLILIRLLLKYKTKSGVDLD